MIDVLSEVSRKVQENNLDFELHHRLRGDGRSSLSALELALPPAAFGPANGRITRAGGSTNEVHAYDEQDVA